MNEIEVIERKIHEYGSYAGRYCQIKIRENKNYLPFFYKGKILDIGVSVKIDDFLIGVQNFDILDIKNIRILTEEEIRRGLSEQEKRLKKLNPPEEVSV